MRARFFLVLCLFLLLVDCVLATDDSFKPYLHKASVPDAPEVRLFGQYSTNLFPGSAIYSYPVEVPKGVNGLQPNIVLSYNSQSVKQRPGVLGAGWSLNQDLVYRDVNSTLDDTGDDKFILILDDNMYELVLYNGFYHTEVDYWFRIDFSDGYWVVTKQDGTRYRFGFNADSNLSSNTGRGYSVKWFLDQVEDTHGNRISYSYSQNPFGEDSGAVYLSSISYNNDSKRVVNFNYEPSVRPDRRRVYEQGNLFEESRRLSDVSVLFDGELVRRHHFDYVSLGSALSALSNIVLFGDDNSSVLFNVSFGYYSSENGFTNQTSDWKSPSLFANVSHADYGARLVDLNRDGFVDIIQAMDAAFNESWINDKDGGWVSDSAWNSPVNIVTTSGADQGVRFGDVNKDGFDDLLTSSYSGSRSVFLNTGHGWTLSSWVSPFDFINIDGRDTGAQLVDVNGDGRADLINASAGFDRKVYLNTGSGWSLSSWVFPTDFVDTGVDQGARFVDVNGDGLVDVLQSSSLASVVRQAWLNNGSGWVNSSVWLPPSNFYFTESGVPDTGVRFADVNGDGLVDILKDYANGTVTNRSAWLNNGSGWSQDSSWLAPDSFTEDGHNLGRRLADVNGDGFVDFIVSDLVSGNYTWTKNNTLPYLLRSVTNEYGGVTLINYTWSTQFNNSDNGTSELGFNIFVVSSVDKNNSLSSGFNAYGQTEYNYSLGQYDYDKSEFRGFGASDEVKPGSVVRHYFYQDDARRGKEYQTEVYDTDGALFSMVVKDYNYTYDNGIYNLSLRSQAEYSYDGNEDPVVRNKSFEYNVFGNPRFVTDYGDVDVSGDEKYYNYSYAQNTDDWIINKVSRLTVYDAGMNKVKESKYYYDGLGLNGLSSTGDLTKTEAWLDDDNSSYAWFGYDAFGNLVSRTDALGYATTYAYDSDGVFMKSLVNPLGHVVFYDYDEGTGNLLYEEKNSVRTSYEYDAFGRIVKEVKPYDSSLQPTKEYVYVFDGVAPEEVIVKLKTTGNRTDNVSYFYDGFAGLVQVKTEVEYGQEVVKNIFYDDEFRVGSEQNPYFASYSDGLASRSSSANVTNYSYDALDRVVFVLNGDGTNKTVVFDRYNVSDYDENSHRHTYTLDAGRIAKVYEHVVDPFTSRAEVYETSYGYDANDNLVEIIDNEGNEFLFEYDSLGRKTGMVDPDMGTWTYKYDANGNLVEQTDNRGEIINLTYDGLNRVLSKKSDDVNISFGYDKDYQGTLSNITINNKTFSYEYDDRLRITRESVNADGVIFSHDFLYDSQNRLVSDNGLGYLFNKQGLVERISGYLNGSDYNAFGSVVNKTYSNGLITNYTYNSANNRLLSIISPNVQNLTYTYDNVGNILTINDAQMGRLSTMTYDYLDRLVTATVGSDSYVYSFNSIGNIMKIVKNNEAKKFVYNGLAHAPAKVIDGSAGVDVYDPRDLNTGARNRVLEFFLVNDLSSSVNANFSVDLGNGSRVSSSSSLNLSALDEGIVLFENSYASGGDYDVNVSSNGFDSEVEPVKFGARALSLELVSHTIANYSFEFVVSNDLNVTISVNWNCSNGASSASAVNVSANSNYTFNVSYNYSSPGEQDLFCEVMSVDGNDTSSLVFDIKGVEVEDYDVLFENASFRVVEFRARNYFSNLSVEVNVTTDSVSSNDFNISSGDDVVVIVETNYSSDNNKSVDVKLTSGSISDNYVENFVLEGVRVWNFSFNRINNSYFNIAFNVLNRWWSGNVNWTLSNPNQSNTTSVGKDSFVSVNLSSSYLTQGMNSVDLYSQRSSLQDRVKLLFENRPLFIERFETLAESSNKAVFEVVAWNYGNSTAVVGWQLYSGETKINSSDVLNISANNISFIIIESNYSSSGVYGANVTINSSSYSDVERSAVVI